MACHNSSAFLREAINSALSQTLSNLELILIDDCSTDNTLEIAKSYSVQDDRVLVLSLSVNSGPATARNTGIQVARGEWLGILDSDDVSMPSRFEKQMKLADRDKDLVLIGSSSISMDASGHAIKEHKYPTRHKDLVKTLSSIGRFPPHSSMVYRRAVVEKLSGFNSRYVQSEDYDLCLRLSEIGRISSIDEPLVRIRKHEQNISNSEKGRVQARFGFTSLVCHFLRIYGIPDPSISKDETTWQELITWVDRRMIEEGVFERNKVWANARAGFLANENKMIGLLQFGTQLLRSGCANALIREKLFGSSLPQFLAQEWMKLSCAAI